MYLSLIQPQTCLQLHKMFSKYFQTHLAFLSISAFQSNLFGAFPLALTWTGGIWAWGPAVVSGPVPASLGLSCTSLSGWNFLFLGHMFSSFLGCSSFWSVGKRTWEEVFLFVLIVCAPFNLPSSTGILSFMSEMMQLKFRNIKQLGSCHFSIRAPVTLFSYLFSLLSYKLP